MRRPTRLAVALAACAAMVTASACAGEANGQTDPSGAPSDEPSGSAAPSSFTFEEALVEPDTPTEGLPDGTRYAVTVNLTEGVEWSDGTPLVAADFVGNYDLAWAFGDPIWDTLLDVRASDESTLVFALSDLSPTVLRSLVRANQTGSSSQFGEIFTQARELREGGVAQDDPQVAALVEELDALEITETVSYGPFAIDETSVTAQELRLEKNEGGFNADEIGFDEVNVYWGSTQQSVPLLLSDELDYSTDAFSTSDVQALEAKENIEFIRSPLNVGTALWFNQSVPPFDIVEFRQAVAYAVDREQNAQVALGDAAEPIENMAGFSDNLVPSWLSEETVASLEPYDLDRDRAAELLTSAGFTLDGDRWLDPDGQPVEFEITAPSDFPDFLASAQDASQQLNDFGFTTSVRGIPGASRPDTIAQGDYEAMLDFGLVSTPSHPHTSLDFVMAAGFFGTNNPEAAEGESTGLSWPWDQTGPDGEQVYIPDLLQESITGFDDDAQRPAVETLAQIFNEQLPVVPMFERYTTDPFNEGTRVAGWLPLDHPVYANNQGSDNYVAIQFLNGVLQPSDSGDGSFHINLPYSQPPDVSYSFYAPNSLVQSFNSPTYHMVFPPLLWFSEDLNAYVPSVAQSYSIEQF